MSKDCRTGIRFLKTSVLGYLLLNHPQKQPLIPYLQLVHNTNCVKEGSNINSRYMSTSMHDIW